MKCCFLYGPAPAVPVSLEGLVRSPGRFETTAGVVFEPFQVVPERPGGLQTIGFLGPTLPGSLQTTVFADPAPPGDLHTSLLVDPLPPGGLKTNKSVDPTQTGGRLHTGFGDWTISGSRQAKFLFLHRLERLGSLQTSGFQLYQRILV